MVIANRGAAAAAAAPDAAAAANAPAAAGAGLPAGPSPVQISVAALSELTALQFVAFMEEKVQMGLPSDTVFFLVTEEID